MTPASIDEIRTEQQIFTSTWNLLKQYYHADAWADEAAWERCIDDADKIHHLADGQPPYVRTLARDLAVAVLAFLEAHGKDGGGHERRF